LKIIRRLQKRLNPLTRDRSTYIFCERLTGVWESALAIGNFGRKGSRSIRPYV